MWKYIFSILLLIWCGSAQAQEEDLVEKKADLRPHELKLGINAIRSGQTFLGSNLTTHEGEVSIAFGGYNLVVDYGREEHRRGDTFTYVNSGSYFRAGVDRNFVKDLKSGNMISLGLRYARAGFEDQLAYTSDLGFGEQSYLFSNPNLNARWWEVVFNIRGRVVSNFYMGFTMRWQLARKINGEGNLKTYDIPGFGKTKRQNSTAFDYYLMWRIPFGR